MKDLKENTSWQSQIILRPTLRVWSVVQVIEYENWESKYLWSMKIKTAIWNLHWDGKMYYEVYDENVDDTRELCWKEDSFDTNWFLSWIVIDSVYWW
jgi:hypothetical protein